MSENSQPVSDPTIWQLTANTAKLRTSQLNAQLDLRNPLQGLHHLSYGSTALEGSVLGVTTSDNSVGENANVEEAFVRGNDLVATYRTGGDRRFSLQVYWTVTPHENGVVVIDTLLSLETSLLESFPRVIMKSELPGTKILQLQDSRNDLVLRSVDKNWSYAEMSHPEDPGNLQIDEKGVIQRTLGGAFLEKGVIRRLRLRGAFLPQDNDLQLASECQAELATETPPLTV